MAVAVQAQRAQRGLASKAALDRVSACAVTSRQPGSASGGIDVGREQPVAGGVAERRRRRASARCANGLRAPTACRRPMKRPIHSQRVGSSSSGARPAHARRDGEAMDAGVGREARQGRTGQRRRVAHGSRRRRRCERQRRGDRDLGGGQFGREGVLFEDLRVAPAPRPVELGDDDAAVFQKDLEDAVLVRVELDQAAVAAQADAVEGVEHHAGGQVRIGSGACGKSLVVRRCTRHRRILRAAPKSSAPRAATKSSGCRRRRRRRLPGRVGERQAAIMPLDAKRPALDVVPQRRELAAAEAFEAVVGREEGILEKVESCHSADRSARRVATVVAQIRARRQS